MRSKGKWSLWAIVFMACIWLSVTTASAYEKKTVTMPVNGQMREMVVFTPDNLVENLPLMIVTHGMNQSPEYQYDADKMYLLVDTEKFVLCYLRSNGTTWDTGGTNDQRFVEKAIVEAYTRYDIDPHRVYWSGFSMGSMLIYHSIANMQGKIAAFAPTSGVQFSEQPWTKCKRPVNLIHCHAYADDVFNYTQYKIHEYVENMAKMNGENTYVKTANYNPGGWFTGDKEVWTSANGNVVELFSYNNGGHWPQQANSTEIWKFCKQFSIADEDLDPIEKGETGGSYVVDEANEVVDAAANLSGRTLLATDVNGETIWYVNNSNESPQNVRVGMLNDLAENPFCYLTFNKARRPACATTGNLYTIQMSDEFGNNYKLWGSDGYLNTPPGAWCLFALGLTGDGGNKFGQDAEFCGLWKIDYEEGQGYTFLNVGVTESGNTVYAYPPMEAPQQTKGYVRLFTKATHVSADAITDVQEAHSSISGNKIYDLSGREVSSLAKGVYIKDGKKFVK